MKKMKVLFDFVTLWQPTGAGEYIRRVFYEFIRKVKGSDNIQVLALWDSVKGIYYDDMKETFLSSFNVSFIDVTSYKSIASAIEVNSIDTFVIGCAQYIGRYLDVDKVSCRIVCVVHDLSYEENYYNNIQPFQILRHSLFRQDYIGNSLGWRMLLRVKSPTIRFCRWYFSMRSHGNWEKDLVWMKRIISLYNNNERFHLVAVSDYTKNSIIYNFHIRQERIRVLYSPERLFENSDNVKDTIINKKLDRLIEQKKKYFLIVSAGRIEKNAYTAIVAFKRFTEDNPDFYLVTLGYKEQLFENHIDLDFLCDYDLEVCYANCYAFIYPSLFEGFGYPPIEAMRHAKPVLCSNVCSMPEVLENAPIYFSPLYQSDIYRALTRLTDKDYSFYCKASLDQYQKIKSRQERDLTKLMDLIINDE